MTGYLAPDSLLEMYIFETGGLTEQLEQTALLLEKNDDFPASAIHEIFRIMHTIKGSSGMMGYTGVASLAHAIEDVFALLRSGTSPPPWSTSHVTDLLFESIDFMKTELAAVKSGCAPNGDSADLIGRLHSLLHAITTNDQSALSPSEAESLQAYRAVIHFENGCEMENIRAYNVLHQLQDLAETCTSIPENIIQHPDSIKQIREEGFTIHLQSRASYDELHAHLMNTIFISKLELIMIEKEKEPATAAAETAASDVSEAAPFAVPEPQQQQQPAAANTPLSPTTSGAGMPSKISVQISKLDKLMDLVGEMVIAEAMVTQNPDLAGLELEHFGKAARHLRKITKELQDVVMSVRMVPLQGTFQKMNRIVRDMSRKLDKEVSLVMIGEETEVDKTVVEQISDPLMHIMRNAMDHGIEPASVRQQTGKPAIGTVTLEAKNAGGDVLIIIKDDGKGLSKEKLLRKAMEGGLLHRPAEDLTDKEIYQFIFHPGFSTKEQISEFSGRGVGMDVVTRNIESIGGSVSVDSKEGEGTAVTLKIPLTLAIIDGMIVKVGSSRYTIPTSVIKESFRPVARDLITDPDGNEMIMVRGQCYPILRLHRHYKAQTDITLFTEGILVMVEDKEKVLCLFADELLGEQQVVVKPLPAYVQRMKRIEGLGGCTLLGDGNISLILDVGGLLQA